MESRENKQPQAPVYVLFDSGSQLSYISEKLQCQLKIKPTRIEKLHLNTFGTAGLQVSVMWCCEVVTEETRFG